MNGQFTISSQIPDNLLSNRLTLDSMKLLRHIITLVCLVATFITNAGEQLATKAKCVVNQPTAAELKPLQGHWEGEGAGGKCSITITGNSLHYRSGTNFDGGWWKTTFTLPAGTNPQQLHATIKESSPPTNGIGEVVFAIFKIEDGTLTLAVNDGSDEPPKAFSSASSRYNLKKVQPRKKNTEAPETK
jgi:uncharacterized protein (TIGR03067 family)